LRSKNRTFAFTPGVEDARRQTQDRVQIALGQQSPADGLPRPGLEETLSGKTTAARPPILSIPLMCWRKLSCLLEVDAQKSSRTTTRSSRSASPASFTMVIDDLRPNGGLAAITSTRTPESPRSASATGDKAVTRRSADAVQEQVHRAQPGGAVDDLPAVHGMVAQEPLVVGVHLGDVAIDDPLVCSQQEATRAACRIGDGLPRLRVAGRRSSPAQAVAGVKYCPAPDFVSSAPSWSNPRTRRP
jgi:hypothetical protein